jgi:hypothetical protein
MNLLFVSVKQRRFGIPPCGASGGDRGTGTVGRAGRKAHQAIDHARVEVARMDCQSGIARGAGGPVPGIGGLRHLDDAIAPG